MIKESLVEIFKTRPAGPFLFVGSGFSRRYLNLEDWKGLLEKFCVTGKPFEYYLASANGEYPKIASLLAKDFNTYWWSAPEYAQSVERHKSKIVDETSALRIEISNYLSKLDQSVAKSSAYSNEVELLSGLNVDGVITTNWDLFLEQIFPDYKTYIGQEELLFSNPQEIGEIYKIHGCSSEPKSLVLTAEDYDDFNDKNTYLAAKLITLFVEHPIVFLGYSISDSNISALLRAICSCIGEKNIEQLRKNLIFVQRLADGESPNISDTYLTIDGIQIPLVLVKTNDFSPVYEAIDLTKRKIPARVLRYCKEQLFELVKSAEPEKKICVVDIDEIDSKDDVEFLVGVGVASAEQVGPSAVGYAAIEAMDLFEDLLHDNKDYDHRQVVDCVIKRVSRNTPNIPTFKYLNSIGVDSEAKYKQSGLQLDKIVGRSLSDFRAKTYVKPYFRNYRHKTLQELINECTPENASAYIPFLAPSKIDLGILEQFLKDNESKLDYNNSSYASSFRKLLALYDKLKWGW
ncbi:SIR2 family protein [Photobacterium rosenbergii]|uniref:SIR2 family protein n=1 Tax=Photobacterium rosenbergii TaxID=294936 RepID=UPI001C9A1A16|nr:SIR2 family protein [Photobacterium rosenbergii]MBY5946104.1 SIR2 family protein [Photobacterium rosenbergii]